MVNSLEELKRNRNKYKNKLQEEIKKLSGFQQEEDTRFWTCEVDQNKNGYAVIRFLPPAKGDDIPFVRVFDHGFKGPGGWYIEKCPTTIGEECPACEYNSKLWNSGIESHKNQARKQKRRLTYISNILVVKDPDHPENEGKVFLYKYGKQIFDILNAAMNPEFPDQEPIDPFDPWEGANFVLRIRGKQISDASTGRKVVVPNYEKSEFESPSEIENLEEVWSQEYSLQEFVAPEVFKDKSKLEKRLSKVLGIDLSSTKEIEEEVMEKEVSSSSLKDELDDDVPWISSSDDGDETSVDDELAEIKSILSSD